MRIPAGKQSLWTLAERLQHQKGVPGPQPGTLLLPEHPGLLLTPAPLWRPFLRSSQRAAADSSATLQGMSEKG